MDDRDLERRLQAHFHRTLDQAEPSPELRATVAQAFATPVRRVGLVDLRTRLTGPGWGRLAVVGMAAVVVAAGAIGFSIGPRIGTQPSSPATSIPTAIPTAPQERWFVVVPQAGDVPDKATTSLASEVLSARIRALGFDNFSSGGGFGIQFVVPPDGPSDASTRRVLAATGDVAFVPLPPEDYGDGKLVAEVGKPLPKDEPALFGWEGIESVAFGTDQQDRRTLDIALKPAARAAFGDYTAAHVQESMAILLDGVVASVPAINEPIPGGQVQISSGTTDGSFDEWAAILVGGMLPERWRGASVPEILTRDEAIAIAHDEHPMATIGQTILYFAMHGNQPTPVWSVDLDGIVDDRCADDTGRETPCAPHFGQVLVDATTGDIVVGGSSTTGPARVRAALRNRQIARDGLAIVW